MKISRENPNISIKDLAHSAASFREVDESFSFDLDPQCLSSSAWFLRRIIGILKPRIFTEIGGVKGDFSSFLIELAPSENSEINFIATKFIDDEQNELTAKCNQKNISCKFLGMRPSDAILELSDVGFVFMDGDQNYESVFKNLKLLEEKECAYVVVHDVGWPCARWDTTFDLNTLNDQNSFSAGEISLFSDQVVDNYGINFGQARFAKAAKTGVKTAVEDFLSQSMAWKYLEVQMFYGTGFLWRVDKVNAPQNYRLDRLKRQMDNVAPLILALELNRLLMLTHINNAGKIWNRQKGEIEKLKKQIHELQSLLEGT